MASEKRDDSARAADFEAAAPIIESPNVWALVVDTMTRRGHAGDPRHVEVLYAIFTSRLLKRPMCAFLKAPSSSGKSWLLNRTLELFPPESYEVKSGFSPKAIAYGSTDLRHKILAVQEASGLNGREGNMLVRTLISEGHIRWEVAGRDADGFTTSTVTRPGPIAFVLTTTHETLHKEDETRALSIEVEDTTEHTREVIRSIGRNFARTARPDAVDLAPWHAFQRWLDGGPTDVVIPFAEAIGSLMYVRTNRAKRDFEQLLSAVAVSALLHQQRRERDADGRVVAAIEDYAHAARFLYKPLNEATGAAVPRGVRVLVETLLDDHSPVIPHRGHPRDLPLGFTVERLAESMRVDKSTASRRVAQAKELGLVIDLAGGGNGRPSRIVVVYPLPEDWDVLPKPEYVEAEARGERRACIQRPREAAPPRLRTGREELARRKAALERGEDPAAYDIFGPSIHDWPDADDGAEDAEDAEPAEAAPDAIEASATAPATECPPAAPAASETPLPRPRLMPPIIANAPNPDREDGGYRSRRAINEFRSAVEWVQNG